MLGNPNRRSRLGVALVGGLIAAGLAAAPASATVCPPGYVGPVYCYPSGSFATFMLASGPEAWYRLNDGLGAETMLDSSGNLHHGEYKNGQDSGPVGISADGDFARDFWGEGGYGYVNGLDAPGPDTGYSNYTVEAWFYQEDTDSDVDIHDDASIMQFGGGPAIYIKSNTLRFRNGPFTEVVSSTTFEDNKWYMVVARKSGTSLQLWLRESPSSPVGFYPNIVDGSGTSSYRPGGSPTFYIGYGEYAPWFRGVIDEVAYFRSALSTTDIADQFYADPVPTGPMRLGRPASPGTSPTTAPAHNADSSNPAAQKPAAKPKSRAAKLKAAKAEVRRLTGLVKKAQRWVGSLKHHHASKKAVRRAQTKLKSLQKQLRAAKVRVKRLS